MTKNNICPACLGTGMVPNHEKVGREALQLRKETGGKQDAVAEKMGISVAYLSALENGKRKWTLLLWKKLEKACHE